MLTLCERYPDVSVGQVGESFIMQIWDKWYYVIPTKTASKKLYVSHHWLASQCDTGQLIARKFGGRWWIAVSKFENISCNCLEINPNPDTLPKNFKTLKCR